MAKEQSVERGEVWGNIACHLGRSSDPVFRVTQRSVRDRYLLLDRRFRKKVSEDEKASGTSPEPSEEDVMMEEIISLFHEADRLNECKKKKIQEEASQAEEMRNMSLETFKQSQERSQDGQPKPKKQKRASGADTMTFLKDRDEIESRQRLEELELRKREVQMEKEAKEAELNLRAKEHEERVEQQRNATRLQQQLQNMNMALLQQQQQQTQALMSLLQKFAGKYNYW
ncbi:hypothetical protein P5673_031267 [Acropora cervicornis]|uniref:Uncharacterized protein n=1 Tax=Acropora cervicornis TaxID=6130 RepID=A0AAD9PSX5_ACRCE|nr:hypothetical protein P5673_031267 [Acropora cervicornis]